MTSKSENYFTIMNMYAYLFIIRLNIQTKTEFIE